MVKIMPQFVLTNPRSMNHYTFTPMGEEVRVTHSERRTGKWVTNNYTIPTEEARDLWKRLREKGYERF